MSDLIERQAAIDALSKYVDYSDDGKQEINTDCVFHTLENLPSAQPEPQWIPCSERLPDESGDYMLYRPHFWGANNGQITVCYWNNHDWSDNYRNDSERYLPIIDGMAWMPLPEPWRGEEHEQSRE